MIAVVVRCGFCKHQSKASGSLRASLARLQSDEKWKLSPQVLCPRDQAPGEMGLMASCSSCGHRQGARGADPRKLLSSLRAKGWNLREQVACPTCRQASSEDAPPPPLEVYTDGSCVGSNPGFGGWGWATTTREGAGYSLTYPSTNQRMEIKAAVEGVLHNPGPLVVYSDSSYVVNCMKDKWFVGWRRRGWLNGKKEPVKNRDLWEELVAAVEGHGAPVEFRWVKGHADTPLNNRADELARGAAREAQRGNVGRG